MMAARFAPGPGITACPQFRLSYAMGESSGSNNEYFWIVQRRIGNQCLLVDIDSSWRFSCRTIHHAIVAAGMPDQ
jgi:hypothetical protein